ncbi:Ubiquitin-conjugating enzyme E2 G1 [Turdus rufiventris]|nr:Ubiquitin-conjugating enzyme E2 G1 [Turdus rufiventris]
MLLRMTISNADTCRYPLNACLILKMGTGIRHGGQSGDGISVTLSVTELNKNPVEGFSAGLIDDNDLYRWEVLIIGPPDTLYEGGVFKAHLTFPKDYPLRPPKMKFITEIWHPNVDKNGDVCISILHEPGEDKYGYEKPEERWLPIHTVETIMISVISMLADPNGDSPANVDAAAEATIVLGKAVMLSDGTTN